LVKNLNVSKSSIPDWKNFDIEDIAEVKMWLDQKIFLKDVKENAKGERYIEINWRKYYEYNGKWTPKNSFYIHKRGALFLWDKIWWLSVWDGVSFRYLNDSWENFFFEQRKTRYSWWVMHLQQIYKSENVSKSWIITTFYWRWKNVQITKDIIERYLNWSISDSAKKMVEAAIKFDPDLLIYIEEMSNR
jgi:hypothetical protein